MRNPTESLLAPQWPLVFFRVTEIPSPWVFHPLPWQGSRLRAQILRHGWQVDGWLRAAEVIEIIERPIGIEPTPNAADVGALSQLLAPKCPRIPMGLPDTPVQLITRDNVD